MDMVFILFLMAKLIKVCGKMTNKMGKECILHQVGNIEEFGEKEKE